MATFRRSSRWRSIRATTDPSVRTGQPRSVCAWSTMGSSRIYPTSKIPHGVNEALIPEQFDGEQYFLPYRPNVKVVYVNKSRFESSGATPPTTVEQPVATGGEKLRGRRPAQGRCPVRGQQRRGGLTISEWIVSYGGNPLILNDEGSVEAFTTLQRLWQQDLLAPESLQSKYDTDVDYLQGETAWMAQNWPFTSATFADQGILGEFTVYAGWSGPAQPAHVIGGEVLGSRGCIRGEGSRDPRAISYVAGCPRGPRAGTRGRPSVTTRLVKSRRSRRRPSTRSRRRCENGW